MLGEHARKQVLAHRRHRVGGLLSGAGATAELPLRGMRSLAVPVAAVRVAVVAVVVLLRVLPPGGVNRASERWRRRWGGAPRRPGGRVRGEGEGRAGTVPGVEADFVRGRGRSTVRVVSGLLGGLDEVERGVGDIVAGGGGGRCGWWW